jgi:hypothetical protein
LITEGELRSMHLGEREARVLPHIDGSTPVQRVVERAHLPEGEALRVLAWLLEVGAIEVRDPLRA